jgi:hypothetical protein
VCFKRCTRGLSIYELMLATALIAIIAAGIVPFSVQTLRWIRLRTSVHDFVRELHRARLLAIACGTPVRMEVNEIDSSYRLVSTSSALGPVGVEYHNAEGILFQSLPSRPLIFHPWGTASPAGSYVISGSVGRIRIVVSLTGRLRVEEVNP